MKKNVLILEDLETIRKSLTDIVQSLSDEICVYSFDNYIEAFQFSMKTQIDVFLLDIVLEPKEEQDFSGITFAKQIRACDNYLSSEIIFITSLAGLEADLLRSVHCFDYIEKPITKERVINVMQMVLKKLKGQPLEEEKLFIRKDRITFPILTKEIVYIESEYRSLNIYRPEEMIVVPYMSMKTALEKIKIEKFFRIKKSLAVNARYIEYVDSTNRYVKMKGYKEALDIGGRLKTDFIEEYNEYTGGEKRC